MGFSRRAKIWIAGVAAALVTLGVASLFLIAVTASGTTGSSPPHIARVGRCLTSELTVKPGQENGAAGSIGQTVHFTNVSHATCTLEGYPGMLMLNAAGKPLATEVHRGASVTVAPLPVRLVILEPGHEASFNLGYADATGYGNEKCPTSARVEVTPPNDYSHLTIAWMLQPYGGDIPHLVCGEINVSPVFAGN
jgi:hypothetical protein